jgi:hypothetical protein
MSPVNRHCAAASREKAEPPPNENFESRVNFEAGLSVEGAIALDELFFPCATDLSVETWPSPT